MLRRLALVAAAAGVAVMAATPAWAGSTDVPINPGSIKPGGTLAAGYGVALTSYALTGTLLIAAGIFALLAARRRRSHGEG